MDRLAARGQKHVKNGHVTSSRPKSTSKMDRLAAVRPKTCQNGHVAASRPKSSSKMDILAASRPKPTPKRTGRFAAINHKTILEKINFRSFVNLSPSTEPQRNESQPFKSTSFQIHSSKCSFKTAFFQTSIFKFYLLSPISALLLPPCSTSSFQKLVEKVQTHKVTRRCF